MRNPTIIRRRRLRIGLLISRLDRGFHRTAWLSVAEKARQHHVDAICFDGGVLSPEDELARKSNALYDLVSAQTMDGLLVWSSCLDWSVQPGAMQVFCDRFRPLPVVSIGRALTGIPSVLVDNYQGMREAVRHLIEAHGYRRIAFLRGPVGNYEEVLRYRAYTDVLSEHGIPLVPELISTHTSWERSDGMEMVRLLLDERGLQPGRDLQALLSVGDDMACGAMEALLARGVRIPEDVGVVGFNDDQEGRAIVPSLTTVRQPVERVGACAMETLLALIEGEPVAERIILPLTTVIRQSCGCLSPAVIHATAPRGAVWEQELATERIPVLSVGPAESLPKQTLSAIGEDLDVTWIEKVGAAFWSDLKAEGCDQLADAGHGAFLTIFNAALHDTVAAGVDVLNWQEVLSALRRHARQQALAADQLDRAEDLFQQGRVLIAETGVQAERYRHFQAERDARQLSQASQSMATAADLGSVLAMMAQELPEAGVKSCYLSLYSEPSMPDNWARLMLAYDETGRIALPEGGIPFPAPDLIPSGLWAEQGMPPLLALPLYFREHALGFVLLELKEGALAGSETLRHQISSALEGALLREELGRAWHQAEEANRLKSRFLATVSHELRTPLSLITGTIEMMLRDEATSVLPEPHQRDLTSIGASAQHLSRLIGDVLDLASSQAGELRLVLEPLQPAEMLAEVVQLAGPLAREKGLRWHVHIPPDLPLVRGDRTRLRQVTLNLVSNAIKFTEEGEVALSAAAGPEGVTIRVSDTGVGIPPAEQEVIFDEFRRSDRTTQRGYGGMGLGLAISRRLVALHGGHIGVHSSGQEGGGSTFYFTLPLLAPEPCDSILPPADRSRQVLLLSELPDGSESLRRHLLARGFDVKALAVCDCPDWLDRIVSAPPGAVLLDFEPAAERGWELMRALKLNPATRDVPVVFYALSAKRDAGAILELDYLAKPAGRAALAEAMERQGFRWDECRTGRTILVVDDDPAMLELHARMVQAHLPDCQVLTAVNGRQALAVMAEAQPELVLLDLMMPELDGFGVLEAMREREETRRIPVIVLTAQILTAADMARLQRGVAAVLGKELFSKTEVLAQVEGTLARSKRLGVEAQRIVRQAMAYIHDHFAETISREDLARHVAVNERYLTRCFQQETGVTPITYLTRYRIKQAKTLLNRGDMNVTEVALAVGFTDSGYFSRVFRDEVGVSPTRFRRGTGVAEIEG